MSAICNGVLWLLIIAYLGALLLFFGGMQGWVGSDTARLARVALTSLGLPWNGMFDAAPVQMRPWLSSGAPVLNIVILNLLCSRFNR